MSFAWVLVKDRVAIKRCVAPDAHTATLILGPDAEKGEWVCSRSSFALGFPKALHPNKCRSCGIRDKRDGYHDCSVCQVRRANADERTREKALKAIRQAEWRQKQSEEKLAKIRERNAARKREAYRQDRMRKAALTRVAKRRAI